MTTQTSAAGIAIRNIEQSITNLEFVKVDIDLLNADVVVVLQELVFDFSDSVESTLATVARQKRQSVTGITAVNDMSVDTMIKELSAAKNILNAADQFGLSRLTIKVMKNIRLQSDKILNAAIDLVVDSIKYESRL